MNRPAAATAAARAGQQRRRPAARPQRGEQPRQPSSRQPSVRQNPTSEFYAPRQRARSHTSESPLVVSQAPRPNREARPVPNRDVRPVLYNQQAAPAIGGPRPKQAPRIVPSVATPKLGTGEHSLVNQTTSDGIPLLQVGTAPGRRPAGRRPKLPTTTFAQQRRASATARAANASRPSVANAAAASASKSASKQAAASKSNTAARTTATSVSRTQAKSATAKRVSAAVQAGAQRRSGKVAMAGAAALDAPAFAPSPRLPREHRRRPASKPISIPRPHLSWKSLKPGPMLIDRIIRGRAWIPILAALLLTVVGMRVWALRLGIRHSQETELAAQLASSNGVLKVKESQLSNPARIMRLAKSYGMYMPSTTSIQFVQSGTAGATQKAIKSISEPSSSYSSSTAGDNTTNSSSSSEASNSDGSSSSSSNDNNTSSGGNANDSGGSGLNGGGSSNSSDSSTSNSSGNSATGGGSSSGSGGTSSGGTTASSGGSTATGGTGLLRFHFGN